jgi:pimeloyl-ACP methyl ester carboxylesterase
MVAQARLLSLAGGADPALVDRQEEAQRELFRLVADGAEVSVLREQMRKLIEVQIQMAQPGRQLDEQTMGQLVNQHLQGTLSPWFRFALTFDPRDALRQVQVPVLALNGSLDLQVPHHQNLPEIEKALREAGNPDVTIRMLPGLNHLFQRAEKGTVEEYAQIEETVAPEVLELIREWIAARFASG